MFAREDHAAQIDVDDAIERVGRDVLHRGITCGKAHAHVVVQDINLAIAAQHLAAEFLQRCLLRHVDMACGRTTTFVLDHHDRFTR